MARGLRLAASVVVLAVVVSGAGGRATAGVRHAAVAPVPQASVVIPGKLIVGFRRGVSARDRQQALDAAGAGTGTSLGSNRVQLATVAPRASARAMSLLEGNADVSYVEPDRTIHLFANPVPNDPQFKKEWGLNNTGQTVDFTAGTPGADIGAERAWGVTTGKKSVVVGVIDTGIDASHPDLAANMWINPGENCPGCRNDGIDNDHNGYVDDWRGWDFINNDNNPTDDNGHGTHVAGTIGAVGNNGTGVTGVNWNVQLMPLKFIGADGTGDVAGAVAALRYATAMGVRITNNSWGDTEYSQALYDAIADANAHGDLFVAAAGNDGVNSDTTPTYPADFNLPNIISVGASDSTDHLAYFSNYGQSSVDLTAPGVSIYSTWPGKAYKSESGTSMASPHVAGAAALVLAAHPAATADTIKALLLRTVDHPAALAGTSASQGRLDVGNALTCANKPQLVIDAPGQGFVAAAGHPVSVRLLAGVCGDVAGVTVTAAANGQPIALTAQGDGSYTGQFTPAPGSTTVTATATSSGGTDSGSVTGTSPSPIAIGGAPVTVTSATGEDQLLAFDGTAGTRVSALLSASTIASSTVTLSNPDGSTAASKTLSTGSAFIDSFTLQQTGSYVVRVHPLQAGGGSMAIQLFNVPPDATAAISPGGPPVTLTTTVPGQNAVASFTGTAGRRVALSTSSSISFLKTIIIGPGGTQLAGPLYTSAGNGFIDTVQLPSDGTYTILADPQDERTGPVTLTLYDVPADVTSTITPGGPPASATTTAAGQNALFTFSGVAGRRVSLGVSSTFYLLKTSILNPDGTVLAGPGYTGAGSSFVDAATLKQTGTYTVVADPQDVGTGSVSYTLYDVPPRSGGDHLGCGTAGHAHHHRARPERLGHVPRRSRPVGQRQLQHLRHGRHVGDAGVTLGRHHRLRLGRLHRRPGASGRRHLHDPHRSPGRGGGQCHRAGAGCAGRPHRQHHRRRSAAHDLAGRRAERRYHVRRGGRHAAEHGGHRQRAAADAARRACAGRLHLRDLLRVLVGRVPRHAHAAGHRHLHDRDRPVRRLAGDDDADRLQRAGRRVCDDHARRRRGLDPDHGARARTAWSASPAWPGSGSASA